MPVFVGGSSRVLIGLAVCATVPLNLQLDGRDACVDGLLEGIGALCRGSCAPCRRGCRCGHLPPISGPLVTSPPGPSRAPVLPMQVSVATQGRSLFPSLALSPIPPPCPLGMRCLPMHPQPSRSNTCWDSMPPCTVPSVWTV